VSEEWIVESVVRITDESRLIEAAQEITDDVTDLTGALAVLTAPDRTSCGYEVVYHRVRAPGLSVVSLNWDNILDGYLRTSAVSLYRDGFAR
jgi:hypothetical protein